MNEYIVVVVFLILGILFTVGSLVFSYLVRESKPDVNKSLTYECGESPVGDAWIQFNLRYYIFALLFVIFDVEVIFLFPWAVVFKKIGIFALIEMFIFLGILILGLIYAWKKKALEWT
ncbi:MAG: NADH-quinone oxidoreductase subunit A [Candidatus Firestonebacteria bacterium]